MAYYLNGNKLNNGRPFTSADGTQFPANWLRLSTQKDRDRLNITWIDEPIPVKPPPSKNKLWSHAEQKRNGLISQGIDLTTDLNPGVTIPQELLDQQANDDLNRFRFDDDTLFKKHKDRARANQNHVANNFKLGRTPEGRPIYTTMSKQVIDQIVDKFEQLEDDLYAASAIVDQKIDDGTYTTFDDIDAAVEYQPWEITPNE